MTDIFGAVWTAVDITQRLYQYGSEVKDAKESMRKLGDKINSVHTAMMAIDAAFSRLSPEEKKLIRYDDWVEPLKASTNRYKDVISYLQNYVGKRDSKSQRLLHPFRRQAIEEKVRDIKFYLDVLQTFLQVLQMRETNRLENSLEMLHAVREREEMDARLEKARATLLSDPFPVDQKMYKELDKCQQSQPTWVLNRSEYLDWSSRLDGSPKCLWAFGKPGSGKTCIASFIAHELYRINDEQDWQHEDDQDVPDLIKEIESPVAETGNQVQQGLLLETDPSKPRCGVAIFYCNFQKPLDQDVDTIFRSVCCQLLDQLRNSVPHQAHKRITLLEQLQGSKVSTQAIIKSLLSTILEDFQQSYIVIDALDENPEHFMDLHQQLRELSLLPGVKIFLTSREGDGLMHQTAVDAGAARMHIHPEDPQIRAYVDSRLKRIAEGLEPALKLGLVEAIKHEEQRDNIAGKIVSAADGNYLCAELQITMLREMSGETLRKRLNNLPSTLTGLFNDTMRRIQVQDERNKTKWGQRALLWTIYSQRPLTVFELSHALAVDSMRDGERGTIDDESISVPTPQQVVESTCYFLSIDSTTSRIQVHKAVKEHCDSAGAYVDQEYFGRPQFEMAKVCLRYLMLENFAAGPSTSVEDWRNRVEKNPFFLYAAQNWGWHVGKSPEKRFLGEDAPVNLLEFLEDEAATTTIAQALQQPLWNVSRGDFGYSVEEHEWVKLNPAKEPLMPAIHVLVYFKLEESIKKLLSTSPDDVQCLSLRRYTPLWLACRLGRSEIVRVLLKHGADPTVGNSEGRYCIATATFNGHVDVVKLLLNHKRQDKIGEALLRQQNWYGRLPVVDAAATGRTEILETFLNHMESMDDRSEILLHQDNLGEGLMHIAARDNQSSIIDLLWDRAAYRDEVLKLIQQQEKGWADYPIHKAVVAASLDSIESLLRIEKTAQLAFRQKQGRPPLSLAVERPDDTHSKVVQLLIRHGADPTVRDGWKEMTALHAASYFGRPGHIRQLLEDERCRHMLEIKDNRGLTPLEIAWKDRRNDWSSSVRVLHDAGARGPSVIRSTRDGLVAAVQGNVNGAYLVSEPLPDNAKLPIPRIVFKTLSHDQGWATDWPWDTGTYHNSETWFEITRLQDGKLVGRRVQLTLNLRAHLQPKLHEIAWDVDQGDLGGGSRGHGPKEQQEVIDFMKSLKHNDRVAIVPRARYPRWVNCVKSAEIAIFYIKESQDGPLQEFPDN